MSRRRMREESIELNLTPLIDMIFILLIFFMVTASFVRDSGVEIERPVAQSSESKAPSLIVSVDAHSVIWIDNMTVDIGAVRAWMTQFLSESPDGTVIIAVDEQARTGVTVRVLDACRMAGIRNVSVATASD